MEPLAIGNILKSRQTVPPPAYQWQDLALRVIKDLSIPDFKRGSVFKICKDFPEIMVQRAMTETKELCQSGLKWKYFFKVIENYRSGDTGKSSSAIAK
jgi:hypothetical protein